MDALTNIQFDTGGCSLYSLGRMLLYHKILDRGLLESSTLDLSSEGNMEGVIAAIGSATVATHLPADEKEKGQWEARLFDLEDTVIFVSQASAYSWDVFGASKHRAKLDTIMKAIHEALPPMKSEDPNIVPVNFWSLSPDGSVHCRVRRIAVPAWKDVTDNYTESTAVKLSPLMDLWPPIEDNGRLMLWHGTPGSGKSYGIRSLAQSWQKWCEVHYIVDPEKFFGNADYMLQVILQSADNATEAPALTVGGAQEKEEYTGKMWNLLIMEDSDEFLTKDAKERSGQSMSRLLNLTSGFIGQGLNILVLITTNVPITEIHAALQREGRCMANIEFGTMSDTEASAWAAKYGVVASGEYTIADLYALTRTQRQLRTGALKKPLGFAPVRSAKGIK